MASSERVIRVYQELADHHDRRKEPALRDRFLVLAADAALCAGRADEAERLRGRLLQLNPHHLLKPYASLAEATKSPDVKSYIAGLRRTYMPESAEHLLESLKTNRGGTPEPADKASPEPASRAGDAPGGTADALKVYRLQGAGDEKKMEPPATRPAKAAAPRHAGTTPASHPRQPDGPPVPAPTRGLAHASGANAAAGAWLSTGLFLLTLAAGLGLAFYIFARPFLPLQ